jgi:hypothetical protein
MTLMPRPLALAKLLALGPMTRSPLVHVCGWGEAELMRVIAFSVKAGLICQRYEKNAVWYCAGPSKRNRKKFARDGNNTPIPAEYSYNCYQLKGN